MTTDSYRMPGLRAPSEHAQLALKITITGGAGRVSLATLEQGFGLVCAGESAGESVWATDQADGHTETRIFALPSNLVSALPSYGVTLGDGLTASMVRIDPAAVRMQGPGAAFLLASRGLPGFRQSASAMAALSDGWTAVINAALESGRFLKAGAGQSKAPAIPAAAEPRGLAPSSSPGSAVSRAKTPPWGPQESARRSAIMAKYGTGPLTNEKLAHLNAMIASGKWPE